MDVDKLIDTFNKLCFYQACVGRQMDKVKSIIGESNIDKEWSQTRSDSSGS